ncbi:MAG: DeoR family transcriptional regulator [bacterium]|nr:DeoR family transcriptional regulator [Patescibacteria group bacterium]
MDARQEQLLKMVVENHIETAEPVGSKFLVNAKKLEWSEATVRNDLRALEEQGYLTHPHTSAGRVPTEMGYKFFVNSLDLKNIKISKKDSAVLDGLSGTANDVEILGKQMAKAVAELSNATVVMALAPNKVYYTGLSNLFNQPEFKDLNVVLDVSSMFDRCEECLEDFFNKSEKNVNFFLGSEHPFGHFLSILSFKFGENGLFSLLGPLRMNYKRNWALVSKAKSLIV